MTMIRFDNISNTHLSSLIDDWIKSDRDRQLMKRRLIDGISYERIAEEYELSVKQVYRIVNKYAVMLSQLCNEWATISL